MESKHIQIDQSKVFKSEDKPEWVAELNKGEGWKVVPDRTVEGKMIHRIIAFNPNLGTNGVSMSVIERPEIFNETLNSLNTWEIKFDDFDEETGQDSLSVALIDLEQALDLTPEQLSNVLTTPDFWEEFGERYSKKFLSLTNSDVNIIRLFNDSDGVQIMVDTVFADLIEQINKKAEENSER